MGFEWLAIAMFVGFFGILMTGYPVAFSFAGTAMIFGAIGWLVGAFDPVGCCYCQTTGLAPCPTSRC